MTSGAKRNRGTAADGKQGTASLAKALVGGLSLAVVLSDGRIGLDDAATKYVPEWKDDPRKSKITVRHLGSHTSGADGSSEGGRINTINLPGTLVLYGVPLVQLLRPRNPGTRFISVAPALVDGIWCLELTYQGDEPAGVAETWHGHRVVLKKFEPPAPPPPPAAPTSA